MIMTWQKMIARHEIRHSCQFLERNEPWPWENTRFSWNIQYICIKYIQFVSKTRCKNTVVQMLFRMLSLTLISPLNYWIRRLSNYACSITFDLYELKWSDLVGIGSMTPNCYPEVSKDHRREIILIIHFTSQISNHVIKSF